MRSRLVVVVMALALVAGACGGRSGGSDEGSDTTPVPPTSPPGSTQSQAGMFGTMESPCGPGDAKGATDIGVTDTAITVTSFSDSTNTAVPELNVGIDQSSEAFVAWCNAQGGINGRTIDLEFRPAALADYKKLVELACQDSLALVGGLAVLDDTGAQTQVDCGLVNVPAAGVSSVQTGADLTYVPLPSPPNQLMVGGATYIKEHFPEVIDSAGIIHGDVASLDYLTNRLKEALTTIGYTFVYDGKAAVFEQNWPQFALAMKSAGVEYLTVASSWEEIVNLQASMAEQDYEPQVTMFDTNFYQAQFPAAADGNAEGDYVQLNTWPFTEAADNPAMATYLEALDAAVPGAEPQQLGVLSFSAWLLWADAVKGLGSDVTRASLDKALSEVHAWNAGGLQGTSDPGANKAASCFIMTQVKGTTFERIYPTKADDAAVYEAGKGFACDPRYVVDLPTNWDTNGAKRKTS